MKIEGRDYVTTKQAADELSITTRGVSQLCRRGLIEHMKIGRSIIILKTEITRYKKERRGPGRPLELFFESVLVTMLAGK